MAGQDGDMRIRDNTKADLALAALTVTVTAAAAVSEAVRRVRVRRRRPSGTPGAGSSQHLPRR